MPWPYWLYTHGKPSVKKQAHIGGIPYGMYAPFALSIHQPSIGTMIKKPYRNICTILDIRFCNLFVIFGFIGDMCAKGFTSRINIVKNKMAKPM